MKKKIAKIMIDIIGVTASIITITEVICTYNDVIIMESVIKFFEEWYCVYPVIPIILCTAIYWVTKGWLNLVRAWVRKATKDLGNEHLEVRLSDYIIFIVAAVAYGYVFYYGQRLITATNMVSRVLLYVTLISIIVVAIIQSFAYLIYGYKMKDLAKKSLCSPLMMCAGVGIEWIVLVIVAFIVSM